MIYFVFHKCNHFSFVDRTKEKFQKKNPPLAFCLVGLRTCFARRLRNSSGFALILGLLQCFVLKLYPSSNILAVFPLSASSVIRQKETA